MAEYKTLDDSELIELYLDSQNQIYFGELYDRYANKVYGKCLSLLKDQSSAEDAAQDVFMKIFLRIASYNKKSRFSTWVYSITYNYCIDLIRRRKRRFINSIDDENAKEVADDSPEMSDAEFLEMDLKYLAKALDGISEEEKAMLIMKYQDGISIKELSKITKKSESAVKMQLKRAKQKVRKIYDGLIISLIILIALWLNK